MSQADTEYPVAESSREVALRACVVWSLGWVCVWWIWSLVKVLQGVLLDERSYCSLRRPYWLVGVLNEWEDIAACSIDLEV